MVEGEFDLIARYFNRVRSSRRDVELGIGDDCALLTVADKQMLAVSTDTLVSGVHFLPDIDPADLGYKSLAVNLSDLAAMGADPAWLSLAITLPKSNSQWLSAYSDSLFELLDYYGMQLVGGDTTRGPLSLTLTIHGLVPAGRALTRRGARIGDWIYVTGSLGDSAAGLAILQNTLHVDDEETRQRLLQRHLRPQPRILQGQALRDLASSAIDLSDGLISDLQHILKASECGARINLDAIPQSDWLRGCVDEEQALRWALSGGEDYELCFTVPEINRGALELALGHLGADYTCIGQIGPSSEGLRFFRDNKATELNWKGYDHFSEQN
ncbi:MULTISPECIES: thiamine-phosphate kinase [Pectobacterium]|uniref:Thiamine-monophosphate kinase n=1 Tax=Pectobacterium aquaticum TaxID=2204145 RepID=A0AA93AKN0_9GAMM|nr:MULTISPECIES: thiamine-phosphate kinase [Pectobacterium]KHT19546.1 thiamine monophosphate kinase [Pectobacterium carotovorum subsp. carotovorum]KHT36446.1 thiamine monophosphate kinase [Pectobacterium carotovorum subsp. carotovorum]MBA0161535.1 thiamine-phosphate kinase [Pectobacterium versatile]MBA0171756.1 thiamine-phosphate kinase [Pectobacterium versatile]MBD0846890.1 thiamine monophosphate kinase [Pectobacterium carotovorum subsp. carotovorum]